MQVTSGTGFAYGDDAATLSAADAAPEAAAAPPPETPNSPPPAQAPAAGAAAPSLNGLDPAPPSGAGAWPAFELGVPLAQANPSPVGQMVDWPLPASIAIQLKPELAGTLEEAESARRVWPDPQHRGGAYQSYGDGGGTPDSLPADRAGDAEDLTRPPGAVTAKTATPKPAPASASAAPAPTADPLEIAALELMLADPATQQLIKDFGGPLEPPPTGNAVADSIIARYGSDLASRLNQLQTAQGEVQRQYLLALDAALAAPGPGQPGSVFTPDSETASAPEGLAGLPSRVGQHQGQSGSWVLDPEAFTSAWAQGDSPLQKAYASVHGGAGLQRVTSAPGLEHESTQWMLAGQKLQPLQQASGDSPRQAGRLIDGWERIDPQEPPRLINDELVWFDPERGWVTDPKNLKGNWLDQNFPRLMGVAFAAVGAGGIGAMVAQATGSVVVQGAAMGAVASSLNQYVSTGHVSFKSVLTSALAGGLTAGITELTGLGQSAGSSTASFGQRLMDYTGKATLQGAIQVAVGGKFKDGFVNSLLGSVAGEVGGLIDAQIDQLSQQGSVSESQASTLRLLGRATASALRAVANPGDAAAGMAQEFLSGVLGDAVQDEVGRTARPADPDTSGYALANGDDGLGLKPGGGDGMRWGDTRADNDSLVAGAEQRPIYDFDPHGVWDPEAQGPINATDTPLAWLVPPFNPATGGAGILGGGYSVVRPDGAGGPPGYDPRYDLPTGAPGYKPADPGLGIRVPPFNITVPPVVEFLTTLPAIGVASFADYLMDRRASDILSGNLQAAGVARPADTDAHHIVPYGDSRAAGIRQLLERFDIDINSADNGVFLPNKPDSAAPGSYHPRLNNRDYYDQLREDFIGVSSRQEAQDVLSRIRSQLLNGTYPGSRARSGR